MDVDALIHSFCDFAEQDVILDICQHDEVVEGI